MRTAAKLLETIGRRLWRYLALVILMALSAMASAAPPDLTAGGLPVDTDYWNLGATGMQGWIYHVGASSDESRQILVTTVDAGSPADGILAVNDVILGVDGTGATPVNFTSDARMKFAYAIADAEARNPATLKLRRWRAGVTTTVTITLETLGAYSATAPYNCPKSAAILEKGLQHIMTAGGTDLYKFSALTLLAANDPANPNNAARQARAQTEARSLILTPAKIAEYTSGNVSTESKIAWTMGHQLVSLAEYYLQTGDATVLESIRARAVQISNGQSMFGTIGHQFALQGANGSINGPFAIGYGPVNNAGMPCDLGLVLAKKCGLTDPVIDAALERANRFFGFYVDRGSIPYGEHGPGGGHESNGKCAIAALMYSLQGPPQNTPQNPQNTPQNQDVATKFFSRMATASATGRDAGHTGPFFNYLWAPLGANVGGEQAAAAYFSRASWMYDLARRWDGGFEYNSYGQGGNGGPSWSGANFQMSTATLLTYALPLRKLYITGKNQNPAKWLTSAEAASAAAAADYVAATRTTTELLDDLGNWSPPVRRSAAAELGLRTAEHASLLPTLHAMASNTAGTSRVGACYALKAIANDSSAAVLAALTTDPDSKVRYAAAQAIRYLSQTAKLSQLDNLLAAIVTTSKPVLPLDEEDPLQQANGELGIALFYAGGASGPAGVIKGSGIIGVDRNKLYPAMRAAAANPVGLVRSSLASTYPYLTQTDVNALADVLVDTVGIEAPADRMFAGGVRTEGLLTLKKYMVSEGVGLSKVLYEAIPATPLDVLTGYARSSRQVLPDPKIEEFCKFITLTDPDLAASAQAVLDAIAADTNPKTVTPFKSIQAVTADSSVLTLPANWTTLHVNATDLAKGNTVYTWRKVYGAGNVTFTPNGTAGAKDATAFFDGTPGSYLFEVKMSDSRNLTEVYATVALTLKDSAGNLPSNQPPTAGSQSITVAQGTPTPILLGGSDPEGKALTYAITGQPSHGQVTGVFPNILYTSLADYTGADSFTFKVMDNAGQVASATINITVTAAGSVGVAVYEPFNYAAGGLNGATGTTEVGFAAPWTAPAQTTVAAATLDYGSLQPVGGSISTLTTGSYWGGARVLNSSALNGNGLLANGATLWFSAIVGPGVDSWNNSIYLALANSAFSSTGTRANILAEGAQLGSGIGLSISKNVGAVVAAQFQDVSQGTGLISGSWDSSLGLPYSPSQPSRLIVGKIVWGATSDTIEVYQPDADLVLPATPVSVLTVNVDQSTFDTITFSRNNAVMLDEIRFGATYQSVLQGTAAMTPDSAAPQPNPMTFDVAAIPTSSSSIGMVAATAFDPTGVEYYFSCTAGGGHDSGWQNSPSYTDTGLTQGVLYSYKVKVRDKSPAHNESALSAASSATIPSQTIAPYLTGMPRDSAESAIVGAGLTVGSVTSSYSSTAPAGSVISQSPTGSTVLAWGSSVNLVVSLGYPRISATDFVDNKAGASVAPGTPVTYTLTFNWDMDASTVTASDFSNAGTAAISIGAISETSPGVFTVAVTPTNDGSLQLRISAGAVLLDFGGRAVDTASAITDDTVLWATTDSAPPTPNPLNWAVVPTALSQTQITMTASTATDAHGPVQYFFQNNTNGNFSGWISSATWVDTALNQNTSYTYQVKARDVVGNQTSWSTVATRATLPEADPPLVVSLDPPDNSTAVALNSNLTVTFNENIVKGTGSITIRNVTNGTNTTISVTDTTQVTISGNVLTINPTGVFLGDKNYAILMPAGVVKDSVNNTFAGIALETTWNFTSGPPDALPPTIVSVNPLDGATAVGLASNLMAAFSEEIVKGTGNITLKNLTDSTDTVIAVTDAVQVTISGTVLTINPNIILDPNKDYAVRIDAGAIYDKSGNAFAGITDNTTWNLHTIIPPGLTIHTGTTTTGNDSWTVDANWDNGSGRVPAGATSVEIAASKIVVANSTSTPPYTGSLLIGSGAALKVFKNTQDINALGTGTVTMKLGSSLSLLSTQTRTVNRPIQLLGNASITTGASTTGAVTATFAAPIDGAFSLSFLGNGSSQNHLAAANSFDGMTASAASTNAWDLNWQVYADAAGSLGIGNVTINNTVSLVINAANATTSSATLSLNGVKSSKVASKLVMNANSSVVALYIDGVKQPDGVYDTSSAWLTGVGVLNVGSAVGADTIRPTLASFVDNRGGGPILANVPVTYTVTFSEDMDASTVTLNDFANVGSCPVTFGPLTETSPGVFTLQVTPTDVGTLALGVPAGSVLKDPAGNAVVTSSVILDDTTIMIVPPADLVAPSLLSMDPPNGAIDVLIDSNLTLTFDEPVTKGTGFITIKNLTDAIDTVINVTTSQVLVSGSVVTINPINNLSPLKNYAVRIDAGAFQDAGGNPFAGFTNNNLWNFTSSVIPYVWTKTTGGAQSWTIGANWLGAAVPDPVEGDIIDFNTANIAANTTLTLDANRTARIWKFGDSSGTQTWTVNAGNALILAGETPTILTNTSTTLANVVAGSQGLLKTGTGLLTLSNTANTYTGGTVVNQGNLTIAADGSLGGAGGLTFNANSTLTVSTVGQTLNRSLALNNNALVNLSLGASAATITGAVTGNGGLISPVLLTLSSTANTFAGPIYIGAGINGATLTLNSLGDATGLTYLGAQDSYGSGTLIYGTGAVAPLTLNQRQIVLGSQGRSGPYDYSSTIKNNNASAANTVSINTDPIIGGVASMNNRRLMLGGTNTGENKFTGKLADGTGTLANEISSLCKFEAGNWAVSGASTFTGPTTIKAGKLTVNSLADAGLASPIGASDDTLGMGLILAGGTLQYAPINGVGANGHSTNRNFLLTGSSSIDASGSGPLALTRTGDLSPELSGRTITKADTGSVVTVASTAGLAEGMRVTWNGGASSGNIGSINSATEFQLTGNVASTGTFNDATFGCNLSRTLTLTGSNAAANTIAGNLRNSTVSGIGVLGLTKSGPGTWILNGANTYTGPTTVSDGILLINGNSAPATGPVAVNNTATLGGSGTIGGTVTVAAAAKLSPGNSVGLLTINSGLNISAMVAGTGKLNYELAGTAASDRIAVVGTLTIGTAALGFEDFNFTNVGGLQNGTYTLISYTSLSGTMKTGASLTGSVGNGGTGTLQISGSSIQLVVTGVPGGGDSTRPTLAATNFVDNLAGNPPVQNLALSYTLTFSEDMDAATITAADFGNAGSATVAIGTITETSPGVFTIQVTPTTMGTLQLRVNQAALLTDAAGIALDTTFPISDDTVLAVAAPNWPPVWASNPVYGLNVNEDSAYSATLANDASDANGHPLAFAKVSGPAWLSVAANGTLSGTPSNSDVGANTFTVSVTDGYDAPVQATLNIMVINTNDAPSWTNNPVAGSDATEDSAYSATLAGNAADVDAGASLTYAKVSGPAWLSVSSTGALSGTPTNSNVGANAFTVSVSDGIAAPVNATLNITVINTNDAPTWASNPVSGSDATEDSAYSATLAASATDVDSGATLTFAKVSGPAWLSVSSTGALSGTPANSDVGANSFTVSVSDGIAAPVNATLNITVINTNDAPTWAANPVSGADATEDSAYTGTLTAGATDVDAGTSLTFSKVSGPAWLSVSSTGALSGTPANSDVGANSFTVSVSDGIAAAVTATLNITVINSNDAPTWTVNPVSGADVTENSAYSATLAANATDVDAGAALTFAKVSGPAWLTVAANGALSGTPAHSDVGANAFTVSVSDGIATAVTATLNVTVLDAPPYIVSSDPLNGASEVLVDSNLTLTFSETIAKGTGSITLKNLTDATDTVIDVTSSQVTVSGAVMTINPTSNLGAVKVYAVRIDGSAVKDLVNNSFAGIATNSTWSFSTATAPFVWTQTLGSAQNWTTGSNWLLGTAPNPVAGDSLDFSSVNIVANTALTLGADRTARIWKFGDTSGFQTWTVNAGNSMILAGETPTLLINASTILANVVAGSQGLVKAGTGLLTLSNTANTYTGGTVVNQGNLTIATDGSLGGAGGLTFNANSTLTVTTTGQTLNRSLTLNNNALVNLSLGVSAANITGAVTGNGGIVSATSLTLASTANTFAGPIYMGAAMNGASLTLNSLDDGAGVIYLGAQDGYGSGSLTYGAGAVLPLTLNQRQIVICGQGKSAQYDYSALIRNINASAVNTVTINTDMIIGGVASVNNRRLMLGGTNTGENKFTGKLGNGTGTLANEISALCKYEAGNWAVTGASTFTGPTTIKAGKLIVNSLADAGLASPIGASDDSFGMGLILYGGTLQYAPVNGAGATGHSINRNFLIVTSSSIDASGSGPLAFTRTGDLSPELSGRTITKADTGSVVTVASTAGLAEGMRVTWNGGASAGSIGSINSATEFQLTGNVASTGTFNDATFGCNLSRTLTLTGSNAAANTIAGNLRNSTVSGIGVLGLTKSGPGTWILNGANTYTGPTTISDGTLLINGNSASATGAVAVNNTATLGGSGTIGGTVTVTAAAKLSPGNSVGLLTISGGLNISAMAAGTGKLNYDLAGSTAASDRIAAGGTLTIGAAALGFADFVFTDVGGLQNGTYTLITSAGISGTLNTSNLSGSIGAGGTGTLQINGTSLELVVSGITSFAPAPLVSDMQSWAQSYNKPGLSDPTADFDGDGLSNADERAWGLDPTNPASSRPIKSHLDPTTGTFAYTRRNPSLTNLKYTVWYSSDLVNWTEDHGAKQNPHASVTENIENVEVTISPALLRTNKLFVRVSAAE